MAARALVFDLDGTVWDSHPWLARIIGGSEEPAYGAALASLREHQPAARLLRTARVSPARFASACDAAEELALYPGVIEALEELTERGTPLAVVTNLPAWMAEPMLERQGIRHYLQPVVSYSRVGKARRITQAIAVLGARQGHDTWYIGDTEADGRAAFEASVSFAWASYGYGPPTLDGADTVLDQFPDVLAL
jgi:phosphoglycolate phosphatase-like HAD superfamily hydrolase